MKVLVAAATRHGASGEIGRAIAMELSAHGYEVEYLDIDHVVAVDTYDAAIVGSAVYGGRWLPAARTFVDEHREVLYRIPVWLFSSGPVGDAPSEAEPPIDAAPIAELVNAKEHRLLSGRLDKSKLSLSERAMVMVVRARYGDYRDWVDIRDWTESIAADLGEVGRHPSVS